MSKKPFFGPDNPHPLSTLSTELVWEGKYDEYGNRREVDIAGCSMPMQKIETIDEPRREAIAEGKLALFEQQMRKKRTDDFRNMLIWGDNKLVMASLLKQFKGKIDLIYIDPPFDVGADFTMDVPIGEEKDKVFKDQSTLEMVAYRDTWGKGTESYLQMMLERIVLIRELLSETGCVWVHCDWRVSGYLRLILEDIFGPDNFRNEIIWKRATMSGAKAVGNQCGRNHDTIFYFSKSSRHKYIHQYLEYSQDYIDKKFIYKEPDGRRYRLQPKGTRSEEAIERFRSEGRIVETESGYIQIKFHLDKMKGIALDDVWLDIQDIRTIQGVEDTGYDTQKPEFLLERIVKVASKENNLIADLFCGSGTTGVVSERLGRRWIMADLGRFAIHTSRKRLIDLQRNLYDEGKPYRAFDVYNLGRYERQWWQQEQLQGADDEHRRVVLEFFKAEILDNAPSPLIRGRKGPAFCHVDGIDSTFTREEAKDVAQAVAQAGGKQCYCLAWEFEMDLRLTTAALEKELGVKLMLIRIPREIMEKNRKNPPPFLEMAVLEAEPIYRSKGKDRTVDIKLTKFMPSLAEVPSKELEALKERAIKSGMDFIDFWAVDFDWQPGKPFNHNWQDYRTRKDRSLKTVSDAAHKYEKSGTYTACVKVIDTFGCDTSITVEVKI